MPDICITIMVSYYIQSNIKTVLVSHEISGFETFNFFSLNLEIIRYSFQGNRVSIPKFLNITSFAECIWLFHSYTLLSIPLINNYT